jgi:hypothetical protein
MKPNDDHPRSTTRRSPAADPLARPSEPGAFVGSKPERQAETIPGGIRPEDERIAAHSTRRAPVRDESADPADPREAGRSR